MAWRLSLPRRINTPLGGIPYCYKACVVDITTNGAAVCGSVKQFVIPVVATTTPVNMMGATNSSSTGGSATFMGTYSNVTPGNSISTYYKYGPCLPPLNSQTAAVTTANAPASGNTAGTSVTGLPVGVDICYQAVRAWAQQEGRDGKGGHGCRPGFSGRRLSPCCLSWISRPCREPTNPLSRARPHPHHPLICPPPSSTLQCMIDMTTTLQPICGDVETFRIPVVDTLPSSEVGATNSTNGGFGTLNGQWSDTIPGHTLKTFYRYGSCDAPYPSGSALTTNTTVNSAGATGTMTPAQVAGLAAGSVCFQACYYDVTVASDAICGDVQSFSIPGVHTDPPTNIVAANNTAVGGSAHLKGSYTGYPVGHTLSSWYSYAPCGPYPGDAIRTPNTTVVGAPASGAVPDAPVNGLPVGVEICYQACVVDATTSSPPNCGSVKRFTIPAHTAGPTAVPNDCPDIHVKIKKGDDQKQTRQGWAKEHQVEKKAGKVFKVEMLVIRQHRGEKTRGPQEEYRVGMDELPEDVTVKAIRILPRQRQVSYDTLLLDRKDKARVQFMIIVDPCFENASVVLHPFVQSTTSGCIDRGEVTIIVKPSARAKRKCGF